MNCASFARCTPNVPNHEPSLLMMTCGNTQPVRPSMGSWLLYGLGSENQNLPGFVVMCPGQPVVGPQLWSNSFLPGIYQGTHINNSQMDPKSVIANLTNNNLTREAQREQLDLLKAMNEAHLAKRQGDPDSGSAHSVDGDGVPHAVRRARRLRSVEGNESNSRPLWPGPFADACLAARRLIERGTRMVQIFTGNGQPWDDHGNIRDHAIKAKQTDQPIAALIKDLKARGLLDETLILWGGEFGRTPTSEGRQGPRPQQPRLQRLAGRRRREGRHGLRQERRVRLRRRREQDARPRPARDDPAPDGHQPREADLSLQRPRFPADGRGREGGAGDFGVGPGFVLAWYAHPFSKQCDVENHASRDDTKVV